MLDALIFIVLAISILVKAVLEISVRVQSFSKITIREQFELTIAMFPFIPNVSHYGSKVKIINWCVGINIFSFIYLLSRINFQ